jgi:hypothetical protein
MEPQPVADLLPRIMREIGRGQTFAERAASLGLSPDEAEDAEERAAVMEYDGGLPRQEAEARALGLPYRKSRQEARS